MNSPRISMIAAVAENRAIGKNNKLLWKISEDLKYFQQTTKNHVVIMGFNTFKELGEKPLPNRTNIVLVQDRDYQKDDVILAYSLEEALQKAKKLEKEEIFVIGGGQVYKQGIALADRLYITLVKGSYDAEVFFPDYSDFKTIISKRDSWDENHSYSFLVLER